MYVLYDEKGKGIEVTCFFDMGTSFLSAQVYPTQYQSGIQFMNKLGLKIERSRLEEELKTAANAMEKLEKEKEDLAKRKEKLESDISDCESTIEHAKKDLKTNAEDTKKKESEIAGSKEQVDGLKKKLSGYPE
jgi:septal ring factor EnvC (AmiA/AmiB activator)